MIADNPEGIWVAKHILLSSINEDGWSNIHDVMERVMEKTIFTKDDLVFAYWLLLEEGKVYGTSPIVWRTPDISMRGSFSNSSSMYTTTGNY